MAAAPVPPPVLLKAPRTGRTTVAWSLWMLAMGLAAAPLSAEYVDQGLEGGIEWLATSAPSFLQPYLPKPLASTAQPQASPATRAVPAAPPTIEPTRTAAAPPEPVPEVAARSVEAKEPAVVAPNKISQPERRAEKAPARKTRGKHAVTLAAAESATPKPAAKPARHSRGQWDDPFEGRAKAAAAHERPAKVVAEPVVAKSKPAKSGDSLDDLMAGAASASPSKDRRSSSKSIDEMLKDVQRSHPAPRPTRAEPEPEPLPSLTSSDIARAMAGVKTGANTCGRRFEQRGVADLRITVGKNGKVSDVALRGKLAGSPVSDCITQAVQGASFPPNSGLKFNYRIDVQ